MTTVMLLSSSSEPYGFSILPHFCLVNEDSSNANHFALCNVPAPRSGLLRRADGEARRGIASAPRRKLAASPNGSGRHADRRAKPAIRGCISAVRWLGVLILPAARRP